MASRVPRCAVPDCASGVQTFHYIPTERSARDAWLLFIFNRIPTTFNHRLLLCSAHFTPDSFTNLGQFQAGFSQRLMLRSGAVPTLLPHLPNQPVQTSVATAHTRPRDTRDACCQTDPLEIRSRGTQLSLKTFGPHYRSRGIQASASCQTLAVDTAATTASLPFSSTPAESQLAKIPHIKVEEDSEDFSYLAPDQPTYDPAQSIKAESPSQLFTPPSSSSSSSYRDAKYMVFEECLLSLFETCPVCTRVCKVQHHRRGTFIAVTQCCPHCTFYRQWRSQPVIGSIPVGNLQLSAAIYFSGASFLKMEKMFEILKLRTHTYDAFRRHARTYLEPAIIHTWNKWQEEAFDHLTQNDEVILGGDMRTDSPGHSAKYGSYTMMNLKTNKVIDLQLVQSNEVGGSYHMEKEGLRRSLQLLEANGVMVDTVVSDCHLQVQKLLSDHNINHYSDICHVAKGLSKKINKITKDQGSDLIKKRHSSITNPLYWSATSSKSGPEQVAQCTSEVDHIQNIHKHSNPDLPQCAHPPKVSRAPGKWFTPGSPAFNRVHHVLKSKRLHSDMEKLSSRYQTSTVESFHNIIQRFAPKSAVFHYMGMLCRLYLAAMHFNENCERPHTAKAKGKTVYRLFPKAKKGDYVVKQLKTDTTYCYALNLIHLVFDKIIQDPHPYIAELQRILVPPNLCAGLDRPAMEETVARHV